MAGPGLRQSDEHCRLGGQVFRRQYWPPQVRPACSVLVFVHEEFRRAVKLRIQPSSGNGGAKYAKGRSSRGQALNLLHQAPEVFPPTEDFL
jgi:hypothetical protein